MRVLHSEGPLVPPEDGVAGVKRGLSSSLEGTQGPSGSRKTHPHKENDDKQRSYGCGSKLNRRGYEGFGPCFHLPAQPILVPFFFSHSHILAKTQTMLVQTHPHD